LNGTGNLRLTLDFLGENLGVRHRGTGGGKPVIVHVTEKYICGEDIERAEKAT